VVPAKKFVQAQFGTLIDTQDQVQDALLQIQLHHQMQATSGPNHSGHDPVLAALCLRCFISTVLKQISEQLITQFGQSHGLTEAALLAILFRQTLPVTSDLQEQRFLEYSESLSSGLSDRILQTFQPSQGALSDWVAYWVQQDSQVQTLLRDCGLYVVSDWALLNNTTPSDLEQILSQVHRLPIPDIHQATQLLTHYHAVCRHEYRHQHSAGSPGDWAPSPTQMHQIAQALQTTVPHPTAPTLSTAPIAVLNQLHQLAAQLASYYRSSLPPSNPLESLSVTPSAHPSEPGDSSDLIHAVVPIPSALVSWSAVELQQALKWSNTAMCEPRQWYVYRQGLAVLGVAKWLQEHLGASGIQWDRCSLLQPAVAHLLYAPCILQVGAVRLCVLLDHPLGHLPVPVPRAVVELPDFLPHFLIRVRVQEEQRWGQIQGSLRCDRLIQLHQTQPLKLQPNWTYAIPHHWFDADLNPLLLGLHNLDSTARPLLPLVSSPQGVTPPSRLELERLLPQLRSCKSNLWEVLTWPQAIAIWNDPVLLHWLYKAQRGTNGELNSASRSQPLTVASPPTQGRIQQGILHSPQENLIPIGTERDPLSLFQSAGTDEGALLKDLQHQGIDIPATAARAYRDLRLAQVSLRFYTLSWPLPPVAEQEPQWILLFILGPHPQAHLSQAVSLQVRDVARVLGVQTLPSESAFTYLYTQVTGAWEDQYWVTIRLDQAVPETTIRLSPFQVEPPMV
jgi:hypothetical protein